MALSRTDYSTTTAYDRGASTAAVNTASFTPPNNSLLVIVAGLIADNDAAVRPTSLTITDDLGAHLTYTVRVTTGNPAQWGYGARIWTAPVTTGASMQIQIGSGAAQANAIYIRRFAYTGYDTVTPTGATATGTDANGTGAASITLSGTPASTSEVIGVLSGVVVSGSATVTEGSGWTEVDESLDTGWGYFEVQTRTGSTSTTVAWAEVGNAANPLEAMLAALEIRAAAGSTPPLFRNNPGGHLSGLGSGGPFFQNPLQRCRESVGSGWKRLNGLLVPDHITSRRRLA
jgi:hypothetical protein